MQPVTQFAAALRQVLGTCSVDSAANAAAYAKLVFTGPAECYGLSLLGTASGAGTFQLVDATATGVGGTVKWQTTIIPMQYTESFIRPLKFTNGLVISYTATAAVTLNSNVYWGTGPNTHG
jgi:hypothetical protein